MPTGYIPICELSVLFDRGRQTWLYSRRGGGGNGWDTAVQGDIRGHTQEDRLRGILRERAFAGGACALRDVPRQPFDDTGLAGGAVQGGVHSEGTRQREFCKAEDVRAAADEVPLLCQQPEGAAHPDKKSDPGLRPHRGGRGQVSGVDRAGEERQVYALAQAGAPAFSGGLPADDRDDLSASEPVFVAGAGRTAGRFAVRISGDIL